MHKIVYLRFIYRNVCIKFYVYVSVLFCGRFPQCLPFLRENFSDPYSINILFFVFYSIILYSLF